MFRKNTTPVALLWIALLGACTDQADSVFEPSSEVTFARDGEGSAVAISALTRNVYVGADLSPIFEVDFNNPLAVVQAAAGVWAEVQSTRFEERACSPGRRDRGATAPPDRSPGSGEVHHDRPRD